jgi:hypothetical protein
MPSDKLISNFSLQHISAFSFCPSLSLLIFAFLLSFSLLLLSILPFHVFSFLSILPPLPCHLFIFPSFFLFSFVFLPTLFFNSSRVSFFVLSYIFSFFYTTFLSCCKRFPSWLLKMEELFSGLSLKGHGNEADFLRFLHKSVRHRSLTLHFEPFRF